MPSKMPDMTSPTDAADPACCSSERQVIQPRKEELLNRINRIEGQVRGIGRMIESDRYCIDILTQVSAVRSAIGALALQILEDHTRGCVQNAVRTGDGDSEVRELMHVVQKLLK